MIKDGVTYTDDEQKVIDDYFKDSDSKGEDWSKGDFDPIRKSIKLHYRKEQNYTCPYCKVKNPVTHGMAWDIEHIIPKDKKPLFMFEPKNLCVSCKDCNGAKGNKEVLVNSRRKTFPSKSSDYKIVHPHLDDYEKHIDAVCPGDLYRPLSEKGEFTIVTCRLLRFYGLVDKEQPDNEIDELAKAMVSASGVARQVLEDELVKRIKSKQQANTG